MKACTGLAAACQSRHFDRSIKRQGAWPDFGVVIGVNAETSLLGYACLAWVADFWRCSSMAPRRIGWSWSTPAPTSRSGFTGCEPGTELILTPRQLKAGICHLPGDTFPKRFAAMVSAQCESQEYR
jgi:hypothetical protein